MGCERCGRKDHCSVARGDWNFCIIDAMGWYLDGDDIVTRQDEHEVGGEG